MRPRNPPNTCTMRWRDQPANTNNYLITLAVSEQSIRKCGIHHLIFRILLARRSLALRDGRHTRSATKTRTTTGVNVLRQIFVEQRGGLCVVTIEVSIERLAMYMLRLSNCNRVERVASSWVVVEGVTELPLELQHFCGSKGRSSGC